MKTKEKENSAIFSGNNQQNSEAKHTVRHIYEAVFFQIKREPAG